MANRYFAGNSLAEFSRSSLTVVESTTSGKFDSTYVSSALSLSNVSDTATSTPFSATGTVWLAFEWALSGSGYVANAPIATFLNGSTNAYRLTWGSSGGLIQMQYWNGSAWTNCGSTASVTLSTLVRVCIKIVQNSSMELFLAGSSQTSGSVSSGQTTVTKLVMQTAANSANYYSQVMVADYDIRDSHFMPRTLNGNSAANTGAASGVYGDINETVLDESTSVKISASGNKAGQTKASLTVPAGFIIGAMVVSGRGRVNGTITDAKLGVRSGGGTNSSGSGLSYNGGYEPRQRIVENDPDTATNFTQSGFNNAEIYEEAV